MRFNIFNKFNFKKNNISYIFFRLFKYFSRKRKIQLIGLLFLMILSGYAELVSLGTLIPFLSILSDPSKALNLPFFNFFYLEEFSDQNVLLISGLLFISAISFAGFIKCFSLYLIGKFSSKIGINLSHQIFRGILYKDYTYHLSQNSSELISSLSIRLNGTVYGITTILQIASSFFVVVSIILGLLLIDWKVTLPMIILFILIYSVLISFFKKEITSNAIKEDLAMKNRIKLAQESFSFIRNIIIDGNQKFFSNRYLELDSIERTLITKNNFLGAAPRFMIETIGMSLIAVIGIIWSIRLPNENIVPILGVIALAAQRLLPAFQQIYSGWVGIKTVSPGTLSILKLLDETTPRKVLNQETINFKSSLVFNSVNFKYQGSKKNILEDLNLDIRKGEHIGIIGKTGCGKTTIFDLIMCLLFPTKGHIKIDKKIVNYSNVASWRSKISHVPQNIFIADGTIRENILLGNDPARIDNDRVQQCAKIAKISDYINSLPAGYETQVGEKGMKLSGGQIQRIGIARALYKKSSILLLDEATSALDTETEKAVINSIQEEMSSITLIMIAHRISTLENCDRIIKIEKGKISYEGPYKGII